MIIQYLIHLQDLKESSNVVCGKADLEEALCELLAVIKAVNDSMVDLDAFVKGLPLAVKQGLGALCCRDGFQVRLMGTHTYFSINNIRHNIQHLISGLCSSISIHFTSRP